jgi:hypothetical protein
MTRPNLTYHRPMLRPSTFVATLAIALLSLWNSPSRADLLPICGSGTAVTCAATDVGKSCQGGGKCFEVACENGAYPGKVYNCITCPTIVHAPAGACTISNMGMTCGDGDGGTGTCGAISPSCNTTSNKYVCQAPAQKPPVTDAGSDAASGTGGTNDGSAGSGSGGAGTGSGGGAAGASAGSPGTTSSGGCDVMPRPPKPVTLAIVLIVFGGVFLIVDRLRRGKR